MYESAEGGISPLMVIPRNTQETKEEIQREEAAADLKEQGLKRNCIWKNKIQGARQETDMS